MSRSNTPCFKCEERHIGCHGECDKYLAFDKANKEMLERRRREIEIFDYRKTEASKKFRTEHRKGRYGHNNNR